MSVVIKNVSESSKLFKKGIEPGDLLLKINQNEINDVFDYDFYKQDTSLDLTFKLKGGKIRLIHIKKDEFEDLGLEFETYLMSKEESCQNKCIFCFIDQMPKNMRDSLYFKDDDSRMSFLFGNYITLTNLKQADVDRIIKMHISPVNVSVHTMNPKLRCEMMKNRFAGESLRFLNQFAENGIKINAQIVLCPDINDKTELDFSIKELIKLMPSLISIAIVPVGLTKYRENLPALRLFSKEEAGEVIDQVNAFGDEFLEKFGSRIVFCADEFYLKAERSIPSDEFYESFPQIENGVGLVASLKSEFELAMKRHVKLVTKHTATIATGVASFDLLNELKTMVEKKFPLIKINCYKIINNFFGPTITVSGLVTGGDLISQLKGKDLGEKLILPKVMLKADSDLFLDDVTVGEVEKILNIKTEFVSNDGFELFDAMVR